MAVKKKPDTFLGLCKDCAHAYNPHSPSVEGVPTLAQCPFERWCVLWQRECVNKHYKKEI